MKIVFNVLRLEVGPRIGGRLGADRADKGMVHIECHTRQLAQIHRALRERECKYVGRRRMNKRRENSIKNCTPKDTEEECMERILERENAKLYHDERDG